MTIFRKIQSFAIKSYYRRKPKEAAMFMDADNAAFDLRAQKLKAKVSQEPLVVFLLSLIDRDKSKNWQSDCENLYRTLLSFQNQTSQNWLAVICSSDRPEHLPDDPRIVFLKYDKIAYPHTFTLEPRSGDKGIKRLQMVDYIEQTLTQDGFVFTMDADDIFSHGLVDYMQKTRHGGGYMIEHGLQKDLASGGIMRLGPRGLSGTKATPLWSTCGSGTAIYFDFRPGSKIGSKVVRLACIQKHRLTPILAYTAGFKPKSVPFVAGVYLVNNGANLTSHTVTAGSGTELSQILEDNFAWTEICSETMRVFAKT